ncbi:uncharacterized protein MICPUCDRAFT_54826 [Micromonas pusilla CCMP1545]|uniref:Predicted protein n=1 Tax=Micromonas pusilla (strain CCMP1545) TaxID=564608 RepID=C1NAB0_MICPC|nr:uncharacterized protein MICPUCDRAFT_54826 [Micromonas pusilla CCMP1545]EEH50854.1 predicted protein [Micromonas pusilla CCMP1545]|eukprot:XP_003064874.1 predicted protein [Micromonas pusilla CCMP1545]
MSVRRLRVVVWTCTVHVPVCSTFVLIYFVLRSVIYSSYPQSWRNSSAIAALALCCRLRYAASHNAISSQLVTVIVWLNYFHNLAIWDSSCVCLNAFFYEIVPLSLQILVQNLDRPCISRSTRTRSSRRSVPESFLVFIVGKVKLSTCRRAVLIDYYKTSGTLHYFRHCTISAAPTETN